MKVGILGTGAYGMALSNILIDNNCDVVMWTKFEEEKQQLEINGGNDKLIPNFKISKKIKITTDIKECIEQKELLIIAIPAAFVQSVCEEMKPYINNNNILIATKGIQQKTGKFMHEIVKENLNTVNIAAISGPSFAIDIVSRMPIGLSIAVENENQKHIIEKSLRNNYVKLRYSNDIVGVELCGAIKNIFALASGILDGLGTNESTKSMFLTEVIHDMKKIINSFGGDENTVLSYAGIGDLLLTCTSIKSRNFSLGKIIGMKKEKNIIDDYKNTTTVEGLYTIESIYELLKAKNEDVPIINKIYDIVINNDNPEHLLTFLVEKQ